MIFHAADKDLSFDLAGKHYEVPRGSNVEIPDQLAVLIKRRGTLLTEGPAKGSEKAPTVRPEKVKPRVRVMSQRDAAEARANAKEMREEIALIAGEYEDEE